MLRISNMRSCPLKRSRYFMNCIPYWWHWGVTMIQMPYVYISIISDTKPVFSEPFWGSRWLLWPQLNKSLLQVENLPDLLFLSTILAVIWSALRKQANKHRDLGMIHTLSDTVLLKNLWQFPSILLQPFPITIHLCVSSVIIKLCVSFIVPHATWTGVLLTPSIMRINCPESLNNYFYLFKNSYVFKEKKGVGGVMLQLAD